MTPEDILRTMAETFESRNKQYGSAYLKHGEVMAALLPNGIQLNTYEDFVRFGMLNMIVSKLCRYTANSELNHKDSIHDCGTYCAMLESVL